MKPVRMSRLNGRAAMRARTAELAAAETAREAMHLNLRTPRTMSSLAERLEEAEMKAETRMQHTHPGRLTAAAAAETAAMQEGQRVAGSLAGGKAAAGARQWILRMARETTGICTAESAYMLDSLRLIFVQLRSTSAGLLAASVYDMV